MEKYGLDYINQRQLLNDGLLVARGGQGISYNATDGVINTAGNANEGPIGNTSNIPGLTEETEGEMSPIKWSSIIFVEILEVLCRHFWCYTKNPKVRYFVLNLIILNDY